MDCMPHSFSALRARQTAAWLGEGPNTAGAAASRGEREKDGESMLEDSPSTHPGILQQEQEWGSALKCGALPWEWLWDGFGAKLVRMSAAISSALMQRQRADCSC